MPQSPSKQAPEEEKSPKKTPLDDCLEQLSHILNRKIVIRKMVQCLITSNLEFRKMQGDLANNQAELGKIQIDLERILADKQKSLEHMQKVIEDSAKKQEEMLETMQKFEEDEEKMEEEDKVLNHTLRSLYPQLFEKMEGGKSEKKETAEKQQ